MYLRHSKAVLVLLIGLFASLVAVNNITDYNSNFQFVRHVMSMDTTFQGNSLMWRALTQPWFHHLAYGVIITIESLVGILCLAGAYLLWKNRHASSVVFNHSKRIATYGLVLGIVLWFSGFMTVGAEWFLMWQSPNWNGQQAAFRFITVIFVTLIFLHQQEPAESM